ncbi:MAG TPA: UDP-N-acetylmuramate--L-alanine ligase [Firmicutes bacterium]|nr:UDP-N-acetylmuramate--L-alanine ligase [Bacillota bacterium]
MNHIYFIAIGGAGMSAIARVLLAKGYKVSGSDVKENEATSRLRKLGATIYLGHRAENLEPTVDLIVISSAIHEDNPEVQEGRRRNLPIVHRSDVLAQLLNGARGVAVAGAHGKTTTTSMIGLAFEAAGLRPTILVGGEVLDFGGNALVGNGDYLIAEADESDGSFLKLKAKVAVATNIDNDHLDYWKTTEALRQAFREYLQNVKPDGYAVVCNDDALLRGMVPQLRVPVVTYGLTPGAKVSATEIHLDRWGSKFTLSVDGLRLRRVSLSVPGLHNVQNSLAAFAVSLRESLPLDRVQSALENFKGVDRRLQKIAEVNGITVMDDYAHHPTEIQASLAAIRLAGFNKVIVIFQPHRYSRTRILAEQFGKAFDQADLVIIAPIYAGPGERVIPGVSSRLIVDSIREHGGRVLFAEDLEEICKLAVENAGKGDVIVTMGAGDVWKAGKTLQEMLQ